MLEFALITPILLLMITGLIAVGFLLLDLNLLNHAAQEGAVAGAMNPGDSCGVARVTAERLYPLTITVWDCVVQGQDIQVTAGHTFDIHKLSPIWSAPIEVTASATAVLR